MNNKKKGTAFENEVCDLLKSKGYWVHFITPDKTGSQPFDIIAVKNNSAMAIDCKTCVAKSFSMTRVEENQKYAFDKWIACGNPNPVFFVEHADEIKVVDWIELLAKGSVKLDECRSFE